MKEKATKGKVGKFAIILGGSVVVANNLIGFISSVNDYPPELILLVVLIGLSIVNPFIMGAWK